MAIKALAWKRTKHGWPRWLGWSVMLDNFTIREGAMIPRWYGVAWHAHNRDATVVMPVPLNIVAGLVRRFWQWLQFGWLKPSVLDHTGRFTRDDVLFLRQLPSFLVGAGMGDDPNGASVWVRELADRIEDTLPEED